MKVRHRPTVMFALVLVAFLLSAAQVSAGGGRGTPAAATLGLDQGTLDFDTPDFTLKLVKASQTIAALQPKNAAGYRGNPFDFTPADQLPARAGDGYNHLGDITLRLQQPGWQDGAWVDLSSSTARKPVAAAADFRAPAGYRLLAAADVTPSLAGARVAAGGRGGRGAGGGAVVTDSPLRVTRAWLLDSSNRLILHFALSNNSAAPVTVGGLGFPVVFNNMIQNFNTNRARSLAEAHEVCSFFDPYVGRDGGYLQVTRLSGKGPALLVVPQTGTSTPFEAFRPLNDASARGQTFEGAFEWTVHSQAYAQNEWRNVDPWNPPTSRVIEPGQTASYGLRFLVSDAIRNIDKTLADNSRPVAVGIPGYILPMDLNARLFLNPGGRKVTAVASEPAGALVATAAEPTKSGHLQYTIKGNAWGRARLNINYDDGSTQSVHYYVIKPSAQAVDDMGNFLFTKAWFEDANDPFKRAPSIMTYDRANNRIVTQDTRVWIAGLSDEGGVGAWLAATVKQFGRPKKAEVDKLAQFVEKTVWGGIQFNEGPRMYGVKKSLFFYQPDLVPGFQYQQGNWTSWTSWNKQQADDTGRAYNYPHVVAAYWTMYRLARNYPGLVTTQPWEWYLDKAFNTTKFMTGGFGRSVGYINTGLMGGDIFVLLLDDLKREGWKEQADYLEAAMKRRADRWRGEEYPFGSEMAWDSTGQEEVFAWTSYFGYRDKATIALDSILGYMPTVPHWGYNGNARRYWDFFYGAAPGGTTERQIHHYGSGINAIPALARFRETPEDFYLLRIGYGGTMGALSNIDQEGFPSAAFHSYPQNLRWDTYTGDYGPNFLGHGIATATYIVNHPEYGWQAFGGNVTSAGPQAVAVDTLDSFRKRIYIAPLGLYLTLDAGTFRSALINPQNKSVRLTLDPAGEFTPRALLRLEQPAKIEGVGSFGSATPLASERGALVVPLGAAPTTVEIVMK